ncbi:helix-turn-helix domain-containing protein [Planomonospora sp. ID91781]|uniref:helix-turn-helix domain-containing protein n=1 Tax=Planomonospora sp. ID91781 TaxID=2738135 RepID=UPI0018C3B4D2|nr:helix-turn-helix domain-containing protein [Planomonospora sp. ID91781]MBG0819861.1 helix-turn-helix domain-containing protein [Planomonospora sp. ID91781]
MTTAAPNTVRLTTAPDEGSEGESLLLTVEEAARRLRIGRTRMYRLLKAGEVESTLIGRSRRVPVECLHKYVTNLLANGGRCEKISA